MKKEFLRLISVGKLEIVIEKLLTLLEDSDREDLYSKMIIFSSRFKRNKDDKNLGAIRESEYNLELNKITIAVNDFLTNEFKDPEIDSESNIKLSREFEINPDTTTEESAPAEKATPAQPQKVEKTVAAEVVNEKPLVPPPPREAPKAVISTTKKLVKNAATPKEVVSTASKEPTKSSGIQGEIPMSDEPK